jgi:hypothetical protein
MSGNQSRGLVRASITKGWDPTKIDNGDGSTTDISRWDYDSGNIAQPPGGYVGVGPSAATNSPDGDPSIRAGLGPDTPLGFATPDTTRETVRRGTYNAHPRGGSDVSGSSPGLDATDPAGSVPGGGS